MMEKSLYSSGLNETGKSGKYNKKLCWNSEGAWQAGEIIWWEQLGPQNNSWLSIPLYSQPDWTQS